MIPLVSLVVDAEDGFSGIFKIKDRLGRAVMVLVRHLLPGR